MRASRLASLCRALSGVGPVLLPFYTLNFCFVYSYSRELISFQCVCMCVCVCLGAVIHIGKRTSSGKSEFQFLTASRGRRRGSRRGSLSLPARTTPPAPKPGHEPQRGFTLTATEIGFYYINKDLLSIFSSKDCYFYVSKRTDSKVSKV